MKTADVINQALQDLTQRIKDIKSSEDDDLGEYATAFDEIANRADETATLLANADKALQGDNGDNDGQDDDDEEQGQQQQQQDDQPDQQANKPKQPAGKK